MSDNRLSPIAALNIRGPYGGGGGEAMNPMGMMNQLAEFQTRMNQAQIQRNLMAGQQRFGEIMGTGQGSFMDRYNMALSDPIASAYAMQNFGEVRQGLLAMKQVDETQMRMNQSGLNSASQAVFALAANPYMTPEQYDGYVNSRLSMLPDETRRNAALPMGSIRHQLWDGLENLPPDQRATEVRRRAASILPSLGARPEDAFALGGVPAPSLQYIQDPVTGEQKPYITGGFGPPAIPPGQQPGPVLPPPTGGAPSDGAPGTAAPSDGGGIGPPPGTGPVDATTLASTLEPTTGQPSPRQSTLQMAQASMGITPVQGLPAKAPPEQWTFQEQLNQGADALSRVANTLNIVQDQLEKFTPGRGTEFKNHLATLAETAGNAMGINAETVKGWGEKIRGGTDEAAQDTYMSLLGGYAMTQLKEAISGTGRAMLPEVRYYMEHLSSETNPQAVWRILNNARTMIQRQVDAQQKFPDFLDAIYNRRGPFAETVSRTTSPLGYNTWYGQQNFKQFPSQVYGYDIAPRDESRMYKKPAGQTPPAIKFAPPPS